jgi:hypothetical protein
MLQTRPADSPAPSTGRYHPCARLRLPAAALPLALTGCEAMGELARTAPWAWIGGVVAVLVVVGCLTSRMKR